MNFSHSSPQVDVALIHYPVYNKNQEIIGSAVTNLDIHDIARAGRTFGVGAYYIVTPYADQREMVQEIISHWQDGYGATYNKDRKEAFTRIHICKDLASLYSDVAHGGVKPLIVATSAKKYDNTIPYEKMREKIFQGERLLLLFGTASGLADEAFKEVDLMLPPVTGYGEYNHLSVRSAVSIVLDRLLGKRN